MGKPFSLTAADAHKFGAYRADPAGKPIGGVVVVQEIFGVNHHIRSVCDRLAALGYAAVAPALFDRFLRDFESGYSADEIAKARGFMPGVDWDAMVRDTAAAAEVLRPSGKVAVIGFCMGGTMALPAATLASPVSRTTRRPALASAAINVAGSSRPDWSTKSFLASRRA